MTAKCWCRWAYAWVRTYALFPMMLPPVSMHDCPDATLAPTEESWMEWELIEGFRLWQLMFMALGCAIVISVLLCCFMKCRIPRTKQEIEADYKRKKITRRFRKALNKVQIDEINLRVGKEPVIRLSNILSLEKVTELCEKEARRARRKKRKQQKSSSSLEKLESAEGSSENVDDDDESSTVSSEAPLTLMQKFKKLLGIGKSESFDEY